MIDFKNGNVFKLKGTDEKDALKLVSPLLIYGEQILSAFKTVRDMVIFTDKRVIAVNVQGITGSKKDFTTLPYSKIQSFSIETPGTFDMDAEMELYFSALGSVRFEFSGSVDVHKLSSTICEHIL